MAQNNFLINLIAKLKINQSDINTSVNQATKEAQNVANKKKINLNYTMDNSGIKNFHNHLKNLNTTTQSTNTVFGKLKNTIVDTFSGGKIAMTSYLLVLREINKASQQAKETIKEIDKAITDLSIATDMSRESVSGLIKDYNAYAKQLNSTTTQISSAADDYLRAGKSLEESQALIKDSIMLSKLGKIGSGEATEDLLATMNGFEMSVNEVDRALNAMVAIDMKAATSAGDIATALKYSASSADMAGVSFNKLAAMIGTVQDKTQQSAETVGTFMNTLLSRYRNVKIGQFIDDDGEDLSEVETVLKSLNIQLRDSNQEFRSFETVIEEVALQWDNYSSVQQAAIAKAFSGTRQQNRFIALMEGYNKVLELTEVAANSAGTAVDKFNNSYAESLEAKENKLQASFESMIINSDFDEVYSGIIEATTALVDFINKTNTLKGVFTGLTLTGGIKAFMALKTGITEAYISLNQFQQAVTLVNQTHISMNDFSRLLLLSKNLSASQTKLILSSKNLTLTQKKQILMNQGLSASEAKLKLQNMGLVTSYTGLKGATVSLTNACKGLFNTLLANPIFLITTAITGATMAYQTYKQKVEEANEKAKESADSASDLIDELSELTSKYLKLSEAVKTDESAKDELLSTQDELLQKLDLEGESVDELITKYGSLSEAIRQATISKLKDAQIDLISGLNVSENDLISDGKGYEKVYSVTDRNIISATGDGAVKAFEALEEAGVIDSGAYGSGGGSFVLTGEESVEGTLDNYDKLQKALRVLQEEFSATELKDNDLFVALKTRADEMEESVENYKASVQAINRGAAQIVSLDAMENIELPDTKEEFENFRKELVATAIASEQFIGNEEDIGNAIDAYLSTIPDFQGFFSEAIEEEEEKIENTLQGISIDFEEFENNLKSLESGYQSLVEAKTELEENGILSASTITDLTDSGLIQYLEMTKDGISVNTQAFLDNAEAVKENAIQQLYNAMAHDVESIALGNVTDVSAGAKTALEQAGLIAKEAGENALEASENWWRLGTSVASTMTALGVDDETTTEEEKKRIEETIAYYKNLANMVNDIDVTKTNKTKTSTGTKSSSEKDEYLEEYKTKLSILQDELDQELINERQFYDKSEALLNQYLKDTPEHIKKYEEEISDAEKTLHSDWVNAYQAQHDELDESLNKGKINAVQYCQQLAKLGQEYYGIFDSISAEESIKLLPEQLQKSVKSYQEAIVSAQTYASSLEEIYKQYGNINNVDRNILYWDEENLSKYANAISTWNWDVNLGDYSSVEGFSENIDGLEIAMTPMFDNGTELIPLTQDEFNNYLTQVINAAYENGGFNADNLLAFDAQGFDVEINGVLTHVSNMIAGVEGQIVNGTQLTANDIIAIAGATSEEIGYALNSIYDGYGMHEVQQNILGVKAEYEKLAAEAKSCGYNIDEYIGRKGSASVQNYGKYVKEAKEAVRELSEKIKSTFDDAINGVISILDSQISDLQDACDSITDSYKEQQKAIDKQIKSYEKQKDSLEDQKDAIQDQLDAIEEATEQKRQQLDLEEKLYTVNRKSNQKTQMTIGENGHLTYDIDKSGLASAREDLQEAQQEIEKANLEKQIKALEDQIDSIDDIIDKLNDQKEEFDDLIEATEDYYANIIKGLENYQKQWQKLIDESEKQEALKLAESLGITEGEILGMSQEAFANINDKYKLLLKCIYSGNDNIVEQFAILNGLGTDEFVNAVGNADQALADFRKDAEENLKDTLDTTTTVLGVDTSEEETKKNATTTGNSDTSNMVGAFSTSEDLILTGFNTFTGTMETEIDALVQKATSMAETIVKACEDAKRALESMSNFTGSNLKLPNDYEFTGTGASFADGTGRLMSTEKNAMVGEIAPELVVDTEHGAVQLFDKPTMLDLPKGAIVYNGEQTKRILDNKQSLVGDSKAHSNGTAKRTGMSIEELNAKGEILRKMLSEQDYVPIFDKTKMNYNATNPSVINNVTTINNNNNNQTTVHMGGIQLQGVQNPNDLAEQIVKQMPNLMIQKLNRRL